uniref:Uncharacterized protein n=1 Tax=Knipowitschia caucasica TaxID=637954 RepID=A0AAV2KM43_KNICA
MVKPAPPENVMDVQNKRRSKSSRAEVQEAPLRSTWPKSKLWEKRTAKVQPLNDSTLPPTEDDFVPKKKRKHIFRRAFTLK